FWYIVDVVVTIYMLIRLEDKPPRKTLNRKDFREGLQSLPLSKTVRLCIKTNNFTPQKVYKWSLYIRRVYPPFVMNVLTTSDAVVTTAQPHKYTEFLSVPMLR
ncbi:hypothetical protein CRM22_000913, partial [Opisthorchis felineus]